MTRRFTIGDEDFLLDGRPHRILAGAVHYFRVHPGQWRHRVREARAMGLNTIETYVAWNEHAPRRGQFLTGGRLDLGGFLDVVEQEGMHAVVRPGPYICAEWDNGGLPGWLTKNEMRLRSSDPRYLEPVLEYLDQVAEIVRPRQVDDGGPVILVQIENEYGAYGRDSDYLRTLTSRTRESGITVPLVTVDQANDEMLSAGGIPELHKTASFGSRAAERLATLRAHQPNGPLMCGEFWDGWFDHWGAHHHVTSAEEAAAELDAILSAGASVSIYMFHGGTNPGFTNGANHKGRYVPTVTSYDYDAPLSEDGRRTAKFDAFRDVIRRHEPTDAGLDVFDPPGELGPAPKPSAEITRTVDLLKWLDQAPSIPSETPLTMDDLDHFRGFVRYATVLAAPGILEVGEVRDRAQVLLNGAPVGVLEREAFETRIALHEPGHLEILVEDMGRVNYGPRIGEAKGLIGPITLDGRPVSGAWHHTAVPLTTDEGGLSPSVQDALALADGPDASAGRPALAVAAFSLANPSGLFLDTRKLGKGVAWVNGYPLGRFWSRGPSRTLHVPAPATVCGRNELVLLDLMGTIKQVDFHASADLGDTEI